MDGGASVIFHVGNLSPQTTEKALREAFQVHGAVSSVSIPGDRMAGGRSSGATRGYGFVVMKDRTQGQAAMAALDKRPLGGREVSVRVANPKRQPVYPD
jgi:RNA recognition motif-containing protein